MIPRFEIGALSMGSYVVAAMFAGMGMVLL
jgi:hypothetical protein